MKTLSNVTTPAYLSLLMSVVAAAQPNPGWTIEVVGGPVSPSNSSVKIRVSTYFQPVSAGSAFGEGAFDLLSTDPNGKFHSLDVGGGVAGSCTQGSLLGEPTSLGGVAGVGIHQLNILGCLANTQNPIEVWTATWTTNDFTPRVVSLGTANTWIYGIYSNLAQSFPDIHYKPEEIVHGSALIQVIPAPGALALLLTGTALATRRRR